MTTSDERHTDQQELDVFVEEKKEKYVLFRLADQYFGMHIADIEGIERVSHMTRIPGTPDFIKGVINLRGIITPVLDAKRRVLDQSIERTHETRIIITRFEQMMIGLMVDACHEVVDIAKSAIEPTPQLINETTTEYISGVVDYDSRLINLVDLEKVLSKDIVAKRILALHKRY